MSVAAKLTVDCMAECRNPIRTGRHEYEREVIMKTAANRQLLLDRSRNIIES